MHLEADEIVDSPGRLPFHSSDVMLAGCQEDGIRRDRTVIPCIDAHLPDP